MGAAWPDFVGDAATWSVAVGTFALAWADVRSTREAQRLAHEERAHQEERWHAFAALMTGKRKEGRMNGMDRTDRTEEERAEGYRGAWERAVREESQRRREQHARLAREFGPDVFEPGDVLVFAPPRGEEGAKRAAVKMPGGEWLLTGHGGMSHSWGLSWSALLRLAGDGAQAWRVTGVRRVPWPEPADAEGSGSGSGSGAEERP